MRVNVLPLTPLDPMFREGVTMTTPKFLPRDPAKALQEVKEELYDRLKVLRSCLGPDGAYDGIDRQMQNEIEFLENLLDKIERSL